MPQPSGAWVSWLLPIPSRELAEPDRVLSRPGEVPHPETAARPTHAAGATPRSRPTCIGRYAPALAPRCDDEWDESTDPGLSNCGRRARPAPDFCTRAPHRPPIIAPPSHWCESHKSHRSEEHTS